MRSNCGGTIGDTMDALKAAQLDVADGRAPQPDALRGDEKDLSKLVALWKAVNVTSAPGWGDMVRGRHERADTAAPPKSLKSWVHGP